MIEEKVFERKEKTVSINQQKVDHANLRFWDELCGSAMARSLGITEISADSLKRFDQAYFEYYPYLTEYVTSENLKNKKVLEIGLGFGTLGSFIAQKGSDYFGLDIALEPAKMMQYRLGSSGLKYPGKSGQGSALALPFVDNCYDYVYTIGCLHHTGNLSQAIKEVFRVLKPGGKVIVMLYNRLSFRQLVHVGLIRLRNRLYSKRRQEEIDTQVRALYDSSTTGESAPHTDFVSKSQVRQLFGAFSNVQIDIQNFDDYSLGWIKIRRKWFLGNLARILGLDLYIKAVK